jgi:hypothetical protein
MGNYKIKVYFMDFFHNDIRAHMEEFVGSENNMKKFVEDISNNGFFCDCEHFFTQFIPGHMITKVVVEKL